MSKLKPILLLAIAGGAAVALKKRAQAQDAQPETTPRYAPPAEAGAQPSTPPDEPQARETPPAEDLQTKPHDLPEGTVMPDPPRRRSDRPGRAGRGGGRRRRDRREGRRDEAVV